MSIDVKPGRLIATQDLSCSLEQAWEFISRPENLSKITPPEMGFEICSELPERMYNGQFIEYKVRLPMLGRRTWISEIKHIEPMHAFVDEQRVGPYALWHHYHEISQLDNGMVQAKDIVHFKLPGFMVRSNFGHGFCL